MKKPKMLLMAVLLPGFALAQNAENGKRIFVRDGCYECHGYTGQGTIAGARLAPPVLNAQGMIRYIRKPAGSMPAFTDKVLSDQEVNDIYALSENHACTEAGEGHSVTESDQIKRRREFDLPPPRAFEVNQYRFRGLRLY